MERVTLLESSSGGRVSVRSEMEVRYGKREAEGERYSDNQRTEILSSDRHGYSG